MAYITIIRGTASVGKSTISKELAREIKAKVYHYDRIMKGFGFNYIPGEKWIPLDKFLKADDVMIPKFKKRLEKGENLILDGNFYHKEQINNLIEKLDFKHFVFTLHASLDACVKRNVERGGKMAKEVIKEVFDVMPEYDYGIKIETDDKSSKEVVDEIKSKILNS